MGEPEGNWPANSQTKGIEHRQGPYFRKVNDSKIHIISAIVSEKIESDTFIGNFQWWQIAETQFRE